MTIEATLERIAVALETLAAGGGTVAAAPVETPKAETPKAEKPKATKAEKPKATKPAKEEKPAEDEKPSVSLNDVRAALTSLQKAKGADAPKGLLKEFKAATLSKLETGQYQAVIDRAAELEAEEEAE